MQTHGGVRVDEHAGDPGVRALDLHAQLLADLARERMLDRLAGLDLTAGELPVARVDLVHGALPEQYRAVGTDQHRHGDIHRGRHGPPAQRLDLPSPAWRPA